MHILTNRKNLQAKGLTNKDSILLHLYAFFTVCNWWFSLVPLLYSTWYNTVSLCFCTNGSLSHRAKYLLSAMITQAFQTKTHWRQWRSHSFFFQRRKTLYSQDLFSRWRSFAMLNLWHCSCHKKCDEPNRNLILIAKFDKTINLWHVRHDAKEMLRVIHYVKNCNIRQGHL